METIIIKAKTKKQVQEVLKKLKRMVGLKIQTWEEIDRSLPNVDVSEEEIMKEVRAVRYGSAK
jgi:hypothetical protein